MITIYFYDLCIYMAFNILIFNLDYFQIQQITTIRPFMNMYFLIVPIRKIIN